jgi:hypothetical protein
MPIELATAKQLLEYMNVGRLTFRDAEVELTTRLAKLLQQEITLAFSCPLIAEDNREIYVSVDSSTLSVSIKTFPMEAAAGPTDSSLFTRTIFFPEYDEFSIVKPKIIMTFSQPILRDDVLIIEDVVKSFISAALRRQYAIMRRSIINAKIDSDDLGSFLYRLFNRERFHDLLSCEASSVFALDHRNTMLHLRGTTGLASDTAMSDIRFHVEDGVNVSEVFVKQTPKIVYQGGAALGVGKSGERTAQGQFAKAYWPLQVRSTSAQKAKTLAHRPCVGVLRIVNRTSAQIEKSPFTWLQICCMIYAAESFYNVIEAFVAIDEASFNKDAAFHGSMSVVDTISKNIDIVRRSIFTDIMPEDRQLPLLFFLSPRNANAPVNPERVRTILNTAYASSRALSFQIDRASLGLPSNADEWTGKLITDVLVRAFEMIGDMCISHSADEPIIRPSASKLLEKERPPQVRGSPEALTSVFANLCENSVKYRMPRKPIRIEIGFDISPTTVEVRFRDYGIGILPGEEERIFTRGYRTPRARQFAVRGNGLGLSWCREVLEHFRGSITAKRYSDGLEMIVSLSRR